jgi:RNA polymerase sigma factor (sigma-70 family)
VEPTEFTVAEMVAAAAQGDHIAWDEIVRRYTPLVMSIASRHRLSWADKADVAQTVWLRLVQHLGELREPNALPGWIVTTTRNESLRVLRGNIRSQPVDPTQDMRIDGEDAANWDERCLDSDLLRDERHAALLAGFAELPGRQRELLILLLADPPWTYAEISGRLDIPVGAIGPTRARALDRLRRTPDIAALLQGDRQ